MDDEDTPRWTLEELGRRATIALTGGVPGATARPGVAGPARGRDVPDPRAIRWYASIGLVDRPVGGRGRGARYGLRHLRQLVAVKRLQAQGWSLADIQGRLAAADDETLRDLADLPEAATAPGAGGGPEAAGSESDGRAGGRAGGRFWLATPEVVARPGQSRPAGPRQPLQPAVLPPPAPPRAAVPLEVAVPGGSPGAVEPLGAVCLAGGVVLVLPRQPADDELSLIAEAAAPLVAALAGLGLAVLSPPSPAEPQSGAS